ncbi:hypothetical protein BHE74_00024254 [Ensete ventricosum]|nr:hypothetical protein BHE74_00024254 [Ensete ventricosum]
MIAQRAPKTFGKRPAEAMPYPRKKVKSSGHHKSRHDRGGSKAHSSKGKEYTMDNKIEGLKKEIVDLRAGLGPKAIAAAKQRAAEAQALIDDLKVELEEANRR